MQARVAIASDPRESAADRLRAMEQLEARALGRPKEHVETTIARPETAQAVERMTDEELEAYIAELEREGNVTRIHAVGD